MPCQTEIQGAHGPIQLYRWGTEDPRYIAVLVHGYGEHAGRYEHVADELVSGGAEVYAADYPGHGRSAGERALIEDVDDLAADTARVVALATEAHPELPLALIGHSLGGMVATRFAQLHPEQLSVLVLSGPAIGGNPDILGLVALPEIPEIPIDTSWLSRDPEVGIRYAEDPLVWHGPFSRPTLEALVNGVDQVAGGGDFGTLPTLWMHGEEDPLCPLPQAREAIARVRGANFEERIYPGARHEIFNETNKDEVLGDLTEFLDRNIPKTDPAQAASHVDS